MGRKAVSLLQEEDVAEQVRKFPCLYDKACADYKRQTEQKEDMAENRGKSGYGTW